MNLTKRDNILNDIKRLDSEIIDNLYNHEYIFNLYKTVYKNNNSYNLFEILFEDNIFFDKIHSYMKKTNWSYGSSNNSPSIVNLKNVVFELSITSLYSNSSIGSGGFEVFFDFRNLNILFSDILKHIDLYEKRINLTDLRLRKINRIINE